MRKSNYDKFPVVRIREDDSEAARGWDAIAQVLKSVSKQRTVIAVDCYPGVHDEEILGTLRAELSPALLIDTSQAFLPPAIIEQLVWPDVTDDPVFGYLTRLRLIDFFDARKLQSLRDDVLNQTSGIILIYGAGASLVASSDILIFANLARWEIQMRMRRNEISNLGADNRELRWPLQYKRAFFVDWRVADRHKREIFLRIDFLLDSHVPGDPKLIAGETYREALRATAQRPFRVVPFFDPAPWGGQWMKEYCDLHPSVPNYGWCFDCVPEENSLFLGFGDLRIEVPAIDLVFFQPEELLGPMVYGRFGAEFPIRFDFLDTIDGGNLSFQVHPLTDYIQQHFGMHYTQDESYYILDARQGGCVYLGLKQDVVPTSMAHDLQLAQSGAAAFDADRYANRWPAVKHDHFLIPAGTVHCSGKDTMVLEISATPYIFTFKMWDWGRLGLDGAPRPVHLQHGIPNIQWNRRTDWTKLNLINAITPISEGEGWREERTGLHEAEFIETRRHWFTQTVPHHTQGKVNVLNLVEGDEAIVESPTAAFEPFIVHYAETFIVPAAVGAYTIRPHGPSIGRMCATIKAFVRG